MTSDEGMEAARRIEEAKEEAVAAIKRVGDVIGEAAEIDVSGDAAAHLESVVEQTVDDLHGEVQGVPTIRPEPGGPSDPKIRP